MKRFAIACLAAAWLWAGWYQQEPFGSAAGKPAVVVVEESAKRTPEEARIYLAWCVRQAADASGAEYRVIDQDASGPDVAKVSWAIDAGKKWAKPLVAIRRGRSIEVCRLPASAEALCHLIQARAK